MPKVCISDASTIIGLVNIGEVRILELLYGQIYITSVVQNEIALNLPSWVVVNDDYDKNLFISLRPKLDDGEASVIALALANEPCLLIIDEKKGRRAAKQFGIKITGVVGVIMKAKASGILKAVDVLWID